MTGRFAFSAVVGQDDAKLALELAAVEPALGGVLLRGEKGSAKTTLARGLAGLLAPSAPFIELPLGATEDRVVGSFDLAAALAGNGRFRPGLLAAAHGGVLYADEINLLADHLVDSLLDVAVSGVNIVERDGISHRHPARFVLVGSMNPEEGELRPQLLDRFGLCVSVTASADPADRVEAVRRRLEHDRGGAPIGRDDDAVAAARIASAVPAGVGDDVLAAATRLALAVGAEGLRADLSLCRAAAALAGLDGRADATADDVRRVAPLVLAHRCRRSPFDPPTLPPDQLRDAVDSVLGDSAPGDGADSSGAADQDGGTDHEPATPAESPLTAGPARRPPPLPSQPRSTSARGALIRDVAAVDAPGSPVAVVATVRDVARRGGAGDARAEDIRAGVHKGRPGRLLVLAVDLSGSMGAPERAAAATGTVLGLLTHAYQRRHDVALVGFRGEGAEILLAPTRSVEVARNRLTALSTGGATPLAAGILTALDVAVRRPADSPPLLVVLTDGRATGSPDALDRAMDAAARVRSAGVASLVLDCESGVPRLGLAGRLAAAMNGACVDAAALDPVALSSVIHRSAEAA